VVTDGADRLREGAKVDVISPDVVEKLKAMSPEDRRAFLQKAREQRQKEAQ
jgi:hypothetical protein